MVRRHELSDLEWEALSALLPRSLSGRPRVDDRRVLNGIVWKLRTESAWRDVPERYGSWRTLYTRFRRWALDGTFTRMLAAVQAQKDAAGDIDWLVSVDSTVARAHQHAAGARKNRPVRAPPGSAGTSPRDAPHPRQGTAESGSAGPESATLRHHQIRYTTDLKADAPQMDPGSNRQASSCHSPRRPRHRPRAKTWPRNCAPSARTPA
ncbi:IS5 family transposase [Streptomyces sp. NPDC055085]